MAPILVAESIAKAYLDRSVLKSAYFQATRGSITAVVGRNGSGKTTLLHILAGWSAPDAGFVEFDGVRYQQPGAGELARAGLAFLPIERSLLSPSMTLTQHLDAVEYRYPSTGRTELVARLGIAHRCDVPTAALSGGERRRAELAVVMLRRPSCLILDEPFRGIDPIEAERLVELLQELAREGTAVVTSGHEGVWVLGSADQVVWVREGSTELLGSPAAANENWRFRRSFVGAQA